MSANVCSSVNLVALLLLVAPVISTGCSASVMSVVSDCWSSDTSADIESVRASCFYVKL